MSFGGLGTHDRGKAFFDIGVWPDATLITALDLLVAAGTKLEDRLVKWTVGANMTVTDAGNDEIPDGRIFMHEKDSDHDYLLSVRFWGFPDVE